MRMRVPATHVARSVEKGIRMQVEATASSPVNVCAIHVLDGAPDTARREPVSITCIAAPGIEGVQ